MGRVLQLEELVQLREQFRREKKKVVFTNGCFDIIHRGHVEYLAKAKSLGDILVVGMNTDPSVKKIKGNNRPIISQEDRAYIVSHLAVVDYVCLFEEETPMNLIRTLVPDILIKGSDWKTDAIVGKDIVEQAGGYVATVDCVPHKSTTAIIQRIVERFK